MAVSKPPAMGPSCLYADGSGDGRIACGKVALFDFDDTLVDFDTVNGFIRYALRCHPELDVPPDLTLPHKQYRLLLLKGLPRAEMDALGRGYYERKIRPHLIARVVSKLEELKSLGYAVCVVSASYDAYLCPFAEEYGVDYLLCTRIAYEGGSCLGRFAGEDCLGERKIDELERRLGTRSFADSPHSIAFSDSQTDLPLFKACRRGVVIVPRKSGLRDWMRRPELETWVYGLRLRTILKRKICWHMRKIMGMSN